MSTALNEPENTGSSRAITLEYSLVTAVNPQAAAGSRWSICRTLPSDDVAWHRRPSGECTDSDVRCCRARRRRPSVHSTGVFAVADRRALTAGARRGGSDTSAAPRPSRVWSNGASSSGIGRTKAARVMSMGSGPRVLPVSRSSIAANCPSAAGRSRASVDSGRTPAGSVRWSMASGARPVSPVSSVRSEGWPGAFVAGARGDRRRRSRSSSRRFRTE